MGRDIKSIRDASNRVIDFLSRVEDIEVALWEKKKFITETFYVITVGSIPREFYPEIVDNDLQWEEWRNLFGVEVESEQRQDCLESNPTLTIDTRKFGKEFIDRLLSSYEDLGGVTDGLLVHSENWQALNLLVEKYRGWVKTIYIDPPYNTGNDSFAYRDHYKCYSWISMVHDRLRLTREFMREDGAIFMSIDDHEVHNLRIVLNSILGSKNYLGTVVWKRTVSHPLSGKKSY